MQNCNSQLSLRIQSQARFLIGCRSLVCASTLLCSPLIVSATIARALLTVSRRSEGHGEPSAYCQ
jgi:hypothetical protein